MKKNKYHTKDWTEPNGIFILHIPTDWQYRNPAIHNQKKEHEHIYSFEPYKNSGGCFQLSSYSYNEIKANKNLITQKSNEKLSWDLNTVNDQDFHLYVWYAQTEDRVLIAKYVSSKYIKLKGFHLNIELEKVKKCLNSLRVIPLADRELASGLNKNDLFISSLAASYDLLNNAIENDSYIEAVIIVANQIDAYLRSSILIHKQNLQKTNHIELQYISQGKNDRSISERNIYKEALNLNIIDQSKYDELDRLYKERNKIVHRYIISDLKTRDMLKIISEYISFSEDMRLILKRYEESQFGLGYGIYGRHTNLKKKLDNSTIKKIESMVNDKHLLSKFDREI